MGPRPAEVTFKTKYSGPGLPVYASQNTSDDAVCLGSRFDDFAIFLDPGFAPEITNVAAQINARPIVCVGGRDGPIGGCVDRHVRRCCEWHNCKPGNCVQQ